MNPRPLLVCMILLAACATADAQVIRGTVLDEGGSTRVVGAMIDVIYRDQVLARARTDSAGAFLISARRTGSVLIRVDHPFYTPVDSIELNLQPRETLTVEIRLARSAVALQPLIITARSEVRLAGFHERRRRQDGFGQFISRSEIDTRPAARTSELLRSMRGIEVMTAGRGGANQPTQAGTPDVTAPRVNIITMRTPSGPCTPALFIDGMSVRQFQDSGIDDILKPDMLEGVEIYPQSAGAPAEFIDPELCGVVAFWTRAGLGEGTAWSWIRAVAGAAAFVVMVALTR